VNYTGKVQYVVTESGQLITGKAVPHIGLSGGKNVLAAGEAKLVNGQIRYIDNLSGHYQPSGPSALFAAEKAWSNAGFNAFGKYVERLFK
jgi:filamentous hemagglutinin